MLNKITNLIIMNPQGQIGIEERSLIITAFGLMLIVVIPVIIMTIFFSIKYNVENSKQTQYLPHWNHSTIIECTVWLIPIIIIIILGILTWKSTYRLDPKKPIYASDSNTTPMTIHVISLDWKWLFIYPNKKIATINELVFPTHTPITFNITSDSVMNAFFIPQLGGQIYAMAGMKTELNLIANQPGKYKGISSNFSGSGFSDMKFTVVATSTKKEFDEWIQKIQKSPYHIDNISIYEQLAKPTTCHPVTYFSNVKSNLFYDIIKKFTHSTEKCA